MKYCCVRAALALSSVYNKRVKYTKILRANMSAFIMSSGDDGACQNLGSCTVHVLEHCKSGFGEGFLGDVST